jgi:hypothetical protein
MKSCINGHEMYWDNFEELWICETCGKVEENKK